MTIEFHCTTCQKLLRVSVESAGKKARCPECGAIQQIGISAGEKQEFPPSTTGGTATAGGWNAPIAATPRVGNAAAGPPPAANPFAESPFSSARQSSENPYVSPEAQGTQLLTSVTANAAYIRLAAEGKVRGPAITLLVLHTLGILLWLVGFVAGTFQAVQGGQAEDLVVLAYQALLLLFNAIILGGAWRMLKLRNYGLALAASILAMLPCSGCCWVGLPVGIWALVVLNDNTVKAAFSQPLPARA